MNTPLWSGVFISEVLAEVEGDSSSNTDADIQAIENRLLGEIEEVPTDSVDFRSLPEQGLPLWVYPLGMVFVVAALLFAQRKRQSPVHPGEIRILSKTPLGREGSLAIVEVGSDDGESKKLLLGLHGNSAPRLIDYLNPEQVIAMVSDDSPTASSRGETRESFDSFLSRESQRDQADGVLEDRNDLVDEVLKARGLSATQGVERYQQVANGPYESPDYDEEEDEDPWAAGFRNIYNQKSQ